MRKLILAPLIIGLSLILSACSSNNQEVKISSTDTQVMIFWGNGCPHCENVKKYTSDNKISEKIKIDWFDVWTDQSSKKTMEDTLKKCPNIDTTKGVGVPLAYFLKDNVCLIGDQPINEKLSSMLQ